MPEISLLASTLLALLILALLIASLRPPEGFKARFGWHFRLKSRAVRTGEFYDAFTEHQRKYPPMGVEGKADGR